MVIIGGVNWLDIGDVFQFPFAVVNSFVDLLSYIRIFAVALAGYYIAANFNSMGSGLAADGWYLWLPGSLVIAFGHALNIALCMMSVLVHGVRLNTLEFSNHVGVTWTGVPYRPLAVKKENN
jgi:V/A-type H+-transporting ATPase subunit I